MVTRTFISKSTTIIENSADNFGLNPISILQYGKDLSRAIIYFDESKIKSLVEGGLYGSREDFTHTLKMTNCGSIDPKKFWEKVPPQSVLSQLSRATSFKLIFFEIPKPWHAGVGFDNSLDYWFVGKNASSREASNWFKCKSGVAWGEGADSFSSKNVKTGDGIYSVSTLLEEYDKFRNGEDSIIICEQNFDYGNEDISVDITKFVNDVIDGKKKNYGIGIAFAPFLEKIPRTESQYVGFFNNNTNTFYRPVVETRYGNPISDDRYTFVAGRKNRLYFASEEKLDVLPTCTINGVKWPVKKDYNGMHLYYAEVKLPRKDYKEETILYDTWSDLFVDGDELEEVEQEFVVHPFGYRAVKTLSKIEPEISGINDDEKIYQGDKRYVVVNFLVKYESSEYEILDNAEYRLYVLDGDKEVTVIDWDRIDKLDRENYFILDTNELVPQKYRIDVKVSEGLETRIYKDVVRFHLVDIEEQYRK